MANRDWHRGDDIVILLADLGQVTRVHADNMLAILRSTKADLARCTIVHQGCRPLAGRDHPMDDRTGRSALDEFGAIPKESDFLKPQLDAHSASLEPRIKGVSQLLEEAMETDVTPPSSRPAKRSPYPYDTDVGFPLRLPQARWPL